jgi:hypothetical protein
MSKSYWKWWGWFEGDPAVLHPIQLYLAPRESTLPRINTNSRVHGALRPDSCVYE